MQISCKPRREPFRPGAVAFIEDDRTVASATLDRCLVPESIDPPYDRSATSLCLFFTHNGNMRRLITVVSSDNVTAVDKTFRIRWNVKRFHWFFPTILFHNATQVFRQLFQQQSPPRIFLLSKQIGKFAD